MPVRMLPLLLAILLPLGAGMGHPPAEYATWTFGLSLATGPHSQPYSLFLVKEYKMQVIATEPITTEQFLLQAQGVVPSKANPDAENLFLTHMVLECINMEDNHLPVRWCGAFDRLWKLRFWEYPFLQKSGGQPGRGWAENKETPSPRQLLLLSEFGIDHLMALSHGEKAFGLLRAVGDSAWVDNYRKGY